MVKLSYGLIGEGNFYFHRLVALGHKQFLAGNDDRYGWGCVVRVTYTHDKEKTTTH